LTFDLYYIDVLIELSYPVSQLSQPWFQRPFGRERKLWHRAYLGLPIFTIFMGE